MNLEPGTRVDRYTVLSRIGEGGIAVVYKVRHNGLGSLHALKVLSLPLLSVRERLVQEGQLQASLRHENIVAVTDIIDVEGAPGLVMELVDGPNLETLLSQYRPPLDEAESIVSGICRGVACAHRLGMIHRDLKPANVLIALSLARPIPKIADFGLARLIGAAPTGTRHTRTGQTLGTPSYMAPEQIRDARTVGLRADIFSLGAILYEIVCGQQAFPGDDILTVFSAIASGEYAPPRSLVPGLPLRVVRAIKGALEVDPEKRVPDAYALLDLLNGGSRAGGPPAKRTRVPVGALPVTIGPQASGAPTIQVAPDLATHLASLSGVETPEFTAPGGSPTFDSRGMGPETDEVRRQPAPSATPSLPPAHRPLLSGEPDVFVGREHDLKRIAARRGAGCRLITILATGGMGKTRLVRRFAAEAALDETGAGTPSAVYFCDLAAATDLPSLASAVALALNVPPDSQDPVVQLAHAIAGRGDCLIILDNFEQVVQHASTTVARWLDAAPRATFLATSRERLAVAGEQVVPLGPLDEHEAIALFEARARGLQLDFAVGPTNREDVLAIVQTLDRLPLAIELAAARIRVLSPAQLRERLKERFRVLASARPGSVRQGTLRAAIDWSWNMLSPTEQEALAQLAAF